MQQRNCKFDYLAFPRAESELLQELLKSEKAKEM
jgi:hypothetical protein